MRFHLTACLSPLCRTWWTFWTVELEYRSLHRARGISPTKHDMDVWRTFAVSYWRLDADDEMDEAAIRLSGRAARLTPGRAYP